MFTMFAEVKQDREWRKVGREFESTYEELEGQLTDRVYDGNNKALISFLASEGCAGMPEDVSAEIKGHKYFQGDDVHYCTLRQLLDFDWEKEVYDLGYITEWQYKRLDQTGIKPTVITRDPFRQSNMVVSPFLMDVIHKNPSLRQEVRYFVEYKHNVYKMRYVSKFFDQASIPGLIKLIPEGGSMHDVRIVYSIT